MQHPPHCLLQQSWESSSPTTTTTTTTLLSPHTHRLLRLLRDSSSSSSHNNTHHQRNHSHTAQTQSLLTSYSPADRLIQAASTTSSSSSFTEAQQWELLSRVQTLLDAPVWHTRVQAARVLQGVAQAMLLKPAWHSSSSSTESSSSPHPCNPDCPDPDPTLKLLHPANLGPNIDHHDDHDISTTLTNTATTNIEDERFFARLITILDPKEKEKEEDVQLLGIASSSCLRRSIMDENEDDHHLLEVEEEDESCLLLAGPASYDDSDQDLNPDPVGDTDRLPLDAAARFRAQTHILQRRLGLVEVPKNLHNGERNDSSANAAAASLLRNVLNDDNNNNNHRPKMRVQRRNCHRKKARRKRKNDQYDDDENHETRKRVRSRRGRQQKLNNPKDPTQQQEEVGYNHNTFQALLHNYYASCSTTTSSSPDGSTRSIQRPHQVLAMDLLFRSVDPHWHVRHGAWLGTLALVRSGWGKYMRFFSAAWLHTIAITGLFVLQLDRFGDFSGAVLHHEYESEYVSSDTTSTTTILASSVVAPVREIVGQVLAVVWHRAPPELQMRIMRQLLKMTTYRPSWEVRHGALTAFKYMTAVLWCVRNNNNSNNNTVDTDDHDQIESHMEPSASAFHQHTSCMIRAAVAGLLDESDDVQSAAAQLLVPYCSRTFSFSQNHINVNSNKNNDDDDIEAVLVSNMWKSITRARTHSSCIVDLMSLLRLWISEDCCRLLRLMDAQHDRQHNHNSSTSTTESSSAIDAVATTLVRFLSCELVSIRIAVYQCIQNLSLSLSKHCAAASNYSSITMVLDQMFEVMMCTSSASTPDERSAENACRCTAWNALVYDSSAMWKPPCGCAIPSLVLLKGLLNRYFFSHLINPVDFGARILAAESLSAFLCTNDCIESNNASLLTLYLLSFPRSLWSTQCEAACLLITFLFQSSAMGEGKCLKVVNEMTNIRECLIRIIGGMIAGDEPLNCLLLDSNRLPEIRSTLEDPTFIRVCEDLFHRETCRCLSTSTSLCDAVHSSDTIVNSCIASIHNQIGQDVNVTNEIQVNVLSVRIHAALAGAHVALELPLKVTPIVRALMTSLKNEIQPEYMNWTCRNLSTFLRMINDNTSLANARDKILESVCCMVASEELLTEGSSLSPGSVVLSTYIRDIDEKLEWTNLGPVWTRIAQILTHSNHGDEGCLYASIKVLCVVGSGLKSSGEPSLLLVEKLMKSLVRHACERVEEQIFYASAMSIQMLCALDCTRMLKTVLNALLPYLNTSNISVHRRKSASLLDNLVNNKGEVICPFVKSLLQTVMALMTDADVICARHANKIFSSLVRLAPLVQDKYSIQLSVNGSNVTECESVIDHLIVGKPFPRENLPGPVQNCLKQSNIILRQYQEEGIAWLCFLQKVNLNGALCDSMGLGKTLQALIAIAISHDGIPVDNKDSIRSLVVCPATLLGHWISEISKYFPGIEVFSPLCYTGNKSQRNFIWQNMKPSSNIVITSYAILRNDIDILAKVKWRTCILDEGHLLKNPKTATARAARRIIANHRLILSGTPVQNRVHELWAVFDFLMPNFLGDSSSFAKEFALPITKGQVDGARALDIAEGLEKLKNLHQQVLPFILRREKSDVLKELPPKVVSYVKVSMSETQEKLYGQICADASVQVSLSKFDDVIQSKNEAPSVDTSTLKTLMVLRLICTHPVLVATNRGNDNAFLSMSGKLLALVELMNNAGFVSGEMAAADMDASLIYCEDEEDANVDDSFNCILESTEDAGLAPDRQSHSEEPKNKCVIFAQFTKSLDLVESLILKPLMPSIKYLRLDGRVPSEKRASLASEFNTNTSIRVLLATTRVGGLGLNLSSADTVFFLENDYNPFVDLQAQDRAHRIGQLKCVDIYNFVTECTIEENIIKLQRKKLAVSEAIVNTDNSTMFSMGTDRILDIFTKRSNANDGMNKTGIDIDTLLEDHNEDYASLSVEEFVNGLLNVKVNEIK